MNPIRFPTSDGLSLEGDLREAEGSPRGTAVICHAHPRHGGSKDHPVLWSVRNELAAKRHLTVLAFNFRGIMGSEGRYGGGTEELADVAAAVDRVRQEADGPTVLVGWSFGAWVSLRHALQDDRIAGLVLLGFPIGSRATSTIRELPVLGELERLQIPVLLVAGDNDEFCPVEEMQGFAGWMPRAEALVIEGTNHYFTHREREMATRVGEWVERILDAQV